MNNTTLSPNQYGEKSQAVSQFMSKVYTWMTIGILLSAFISYFISSSSYLMGSLINNHFMFNVIIIAQIACVLSFAFLQRKVSAATCILMYLGYSVLTGVTFTAVLYIYSQQTITQAFFATAGSFLGLSIFGYTTKRDLGPIGTFCIMGLFGLVIVYLLGLFMPSLMMGTSSILISCIGVLVFAGLTAYDTQRIKNSFNPAAPIEDQAKMVISGALMLYLDFINLFLNLLRLFSGSSRQ